MHPANQKRRLPWHLQVNRQDTQLLCSADSSRWTKRQLSRGEVFPQVATKCAMGSRPVCWGAFWESYCDLPKSTPSPPIGSLILFSLIVRVVHSVGPELGPAPAPLNAAFAVPSTQQEQSVQDTCSRFHPADTYGGEPPGGAGLTVSKSSGQIGVLAADGLSDPVAMGTAVRWKRIR